MNNQDVAEYLLYSKIQDNLMFLGHNAILKMNVLLYKTNRRGVNNTDRSYFYSETQYLDMNGNLARGIKRNYNAFLTLENLKPGGDGIKQSIVIHANDLELMRMMLIPKLEHYIFMSENIFEYRDNKLYINDNVVKPIQIDVGNGAIWFKPAIHVNYDGSAMRAVNMYINSIKNVNTLTFKELFSFIYVIRSFDLFNYASNMLAYLGRAPMGMNMYDCTSEQVLTPSTGFQYNEPEYLKKKRSDNAGFFNTEINRKKAEEK